MMFDSLKELVQAPEKKVRVRKIHSIPQTIAFVSALVQNDSRITYASLANAAEAFGEHVATGLSAGQRGAILVGSLPESLQPWVCRSKGGYKPGSDVAEVAKEQGLTNKGFVHPGILEPFINAFMAQQGYLDEGDDEPTVEEALELGLDEEIDD